MIKIEFLEDFECKGHWFDWEVPGAHNNVTIEFKKGEISAALWITGEPTDADCFIGLPTQQLTKELQDSDNMSPWYEFEIDGSKFRKIGKMTFEEGMEYVKNFRLI